MDKIIGRYFSHDRATKALFAQNFGRRPFIFRHNLTEESLSLPALRQHAERKALDPRHQGWLVRENVGDLKWGTEEMRLAVSKAFDDLATAPIRMKIRSTHSDPGHDPAYAQMLSDCADELSDLTSVDLRGPNREPLECIFISAPEQFTPSHIDHHENFLLQVNGTTTVYVVDRESLGWPSLEEWYQGDGKLPADIETRATPFELRPGLGLHNPVLFPHSVRNGPQVSVSLSVAYSTWFDPYRVLLINSRLRRLGLSPVPPGRSKVRDAAKVAVARSVRSLKDLLRRGQLISLIYFGRTARRKLPTRARIRLICHEKPAFRALICPGDKRHPDARQFSTVRSALLDFGIAITFGCEVHQFSATWPMVFPASSAIRSKTLLPRLDVESGREVKRPSSRGV